MALKKDIEAGKAYVTLYTKNAPLIKGLKAGEASLKAFGSGITSVGKELLKAGAAITAPFAAAAAYFATAGSELDRMATRTATSTAALSELGYAAEQTGSSLGQVDSALSSMQSTLASAGRFESGAIDALNRLGLTLADVRGLSRDDQLSLFADRISRVRDPAERAARAVAIFGGAGADLLPLLDKGAAGIANLRDEARSLGLVVTPEQARAASELTAAFAGAKSTAKALTMAIGSALAPLLKEWQVTLRDIAATTSRFVRDNGQLVVTAFKVGAALAVAGSAAVAFGAALSGVASFFGAIASIATVAGTLGTALAPFVGGLVVAVGSITALVVGVAKLTGTMGGLRAASRTALSEASQLARRILEAFRDLGDDVSAVWDAMRDAFAAGDWQLLGKVAAAGLNLAWARAADYAKSIWSEVKGYFVGLWIDASESLGRVMIEAWAQLQTAWATVVDGMWTVFSDLLDSIADGYDSLTKSIGDVVINAAVKSGAVDEQFGENWRETLDNQVKANDRDRKDKAEQRKAESAEGKRAAIATVEQQRQASHEIFGDMIAAQRAGLKAEGDAMAAAARVELDDARAEMDAAAQKARESAKRVKERRKEPEGEKGPAVEFNAIKAAVGTFSAQAAISLGQVRGETKLEALARKALDVDKHIEAHLAASAKLLGDIKAKLAVAR